MDFAAWDVRKSKSGRTAGGLSKQNAKNSCRMARLGRNEAQLVAGCSKRWMEARNSADQGDLLEIVERLLKRVFIWIAGCHTNPNAPHAHMNLRTDF